MICDLAETYHILDYHLLPVSTLAILVMGLRANSRVKMKINNMEIDFQTRLLIACLDAININNWLQSEDATKGLNKPKSILASLEKQDSNIDGFESVEAYEKARLKILKRS